MKLSNFIDGLTTLRPYYEGEDGYHLGAEHDVFYAYATDRPLTPEDVEKMRSLGWFQEGRGDEKPAYNPEDGWQAFT